MDNIQCIWMSVERDGRMTYFIYITTTAIVGSVKPFLALKLQRDDKTLTCTYTCTHGFVRLVCAAKQKMTIQRIDISRMYRFLKFLNATTV